MGKFEVAKGNLGFFQSGMVQQSKRSDGCGDVFCWVTVLLASSDWVQRLQICPEKNRRSWNRSADVPEVAVAA